MTKICKACGKEKPIEEFHKDKHKPKGVRADCKACRMSKLTGSGEFARAHIENTLRWRSRNYERSIASIRAWQEKHPERVRLSCIRNARKTTEEYVQFLMDLQRGCCGICGKDLITPESTREYHIDHDHETGKVRGLLCHGCNTNLGRYLHYETEFGERCREYLINSELLGVK